MSETIEVSRMIPARAERIFNAWLSGDEHEQMTGGGKATFDDDGGFTAWDGYISGKTVESQPNTRIVQTWRTTEFPDGAPDSRLEVLLEEGQEGGTKVTLKQTSIPDGQGDSYRQGWSDHYFDPMTSYFQSARSKLKDAGDAISEAAHEAQHAVAAVAEQAADAAENIGTQAQKTVKQVQKTAKKAAKTVKALVNKAKKRLAARAKKPKAAAKKKTAPKKKKAAKVKAKKRR
jgi:uncharacterized protein YndB with AHSA1/START domain